MPITSGTVIANIPSGVATSIATGVGNIASTSTDNEVTWDATPGAPDSFPDLIWWCDASDAATITDAGSGRVSQWDDKSGEGNDLFQGTNASRPTTGVASQNGLNVLDWSSNQMDHAGFTLDVSAKAVTFFVVYKADTFANDAAGLATFINASSAYDINNLCIEQRTAGSGRWQVVRGNGSGSFSTANFKEQFAAGTGDATSYHVMVVRVSTSAAVSMRIDGNTQTLTTNNGTCSDADFLATISTAWKATVGYRAGSANFDGKIAEIGMYNVRMSDGDCASLETYMTAKWGL